MQSFLRTYADAGTDLQTPMDVAVVMPTLLRDTLGEALQSIFAQNFGGRIHVLLGIDGPCDPSALDRACTGRPTRCIVQVLQPGYSTASAKGGLHPARDGGALRTVLTLLANSRYVAYLDDDNWYHPDHLRLMRAAIADAEWAYSLRWFVHPQSRRPICRDSWESVGPDHGVYANRFGGFVDTNCLMLDKLACPHAGAWWNVPLAGDLRQGGSDRHVFAFLRAYHRGAATGRPTVYYRIDPTDIMHETRMMMMGDAYEAASRPR